MIDPSHITGLILAGGRGSRMGGVDKGLQMHAGLPLAVHAMQRLQPQVGRLAINANRNLDVYAAMGAPVWPDSLPDHPGPLAGLLVGLMRCETPWLVSVPCDSPSFPRDLVAQLTRALTRDDAEIAIAATREADGQLQTHPVFCLMRSELRESLQRFIAQGQRKVGLWTAQHRVTQVLFDDARAFANANTPAELQALRALQDHV